jgi:hypothetical protein
VGAAFSYHGTQPVLLPQDRSLAPGPYGNRFIGKFKDLFNNMVIIDAQKQGIFHHIITDGKFGNYQGFLWILQNYK